MTCPDIERLIDYDGPGGDAELDEHIAECKECRDAVGVLEQFSASMDALKPIPSEVIAKTMTRIEELAGRPSWRQRATTFLLSLLTLSPFSAATYTGGGGLAVPAAIAVGFAALATLLEPRYVRAR